MSIWLSNLWQDRRGAAAVEFAMFLPFFLLVLVGLTEIANGFRQATMVEKGLRAGALYAARTELPLTAGDQTIVNNLVMKGNTAGTGDYLVAGWADGDADLSISTSLYDISAANEAPDAEDVDVVTLTASVPYQSLMPGLLDMVGLSGFTIQLSHEQSYVGL